MPLALDTGLHVPGRAIVITGYTGSEVDLVGGVATIDEETRRHVLHACACTPPLAIANGIGGGALSARDDASGAKRLVGAVAVADGAGELEVVHLAPVVQSQLPHVILTPGGRADEAFD